MEKFNFEYQIIGIDGVKIMDLDEDQYESFISYLKDNETTIQVELPDKYKDKGVKVSKQSKITDDGSIIIQITYVELFRNELFDLTESFENQLKYKIKTNLNFDVDLA